MSTYQTNPFLSTDLNNDSSDDFLTLSLGNSQYRRRSNPVVSETKNPSSCDDDDDFLSLTLGNSHYRVTTDLGSSHNHGNSLTLETTDLGISQNLGDSQNRETIDIGNSQNLEATDLGNPVSDQFCTATIKRNKTAIEKMADKLGLSESVKNQAYEHFKKVEGESRKKRRSIIFAACIYISCRQNDIALSLEEIESVANGVKAIKIYYKAKTIAEKLGLKCDVMMHVRVDEFTKRFCAELQLDSQVDKAALEAAENSNDIVNKRAPTSVAAVVIYVVARLSYEKKLFKDIMEVTGVPEITINDVYKEWYPNLSKIIPKWFAEAKDMKKLHKPS